MIPTEKSAGLYAKYQIRKIVGWRSRVPWESERPITKPVEPGSEYFILRLDEKAKDPEHLKACRIAIHAYADAIEAAIPELAKDLRKRYPLLPASTEKK